MELSPRKFDALIGMPRSGKSTFSVDIIKAYKQNVIIIKHPTNINDKTHAFLPVKTTENWRQGAPSPQSPVKCKMAIKNKKELIAFGNWANDNFRNGLLIIDDASILMRHIMPEIFIELLGMRAHNGMDILLIYHGITAFPIDQFVFINNLFIFCTNDNFEYKKNKIPQYKRVAAAALQAKINYQSTDNKIKYSPTRVNITSL